jgi:hypothetical protein
MPGAGHVRRDYHPRNAIAYTRPCRCAERLRRRRWARLEGVMYRISLSVAFAATLLVLVLQAVPARAQATRTWVSGVGDDANPGSARRHARRLPARYRRRHPTERSTASPRAALTRSRSRSRLRSTAVGPLARFWPRGQTALTSMGRVLTSPWEYRNPGNRDRSCRYQFPRRRVASRGKRDHSGL